MDYQDNQNTAKKFLIGQQIDDLRDKVSVAPAVLADTLDIVYTVKPIITKALIDGKYQNVYTYKRGDSEASFVSMSKQVDIPAILETAKKVMNYADQKGKLQETSHGYLLEVDVNDYLGYLGYTPRPDGSFGIADKKKVWKDLKNTLRTPTRRAVKFKSGRESKVLVIDDTIIKFAEVYEGSDTKKALTLDGDNPPKTFLVGIEPIVVKQMTGFRDDGLYYHPNITIEPKREAKDYKHDLTGYKLRLSNRLFGVLFKKKIAPIRRYPIKKLTEVIGGRARDMKAKLIKGLDTFEARGEIKEWGFCNSRRKFYGKTAKRASMVWIDHEDTPVYRKNKALYKSRQSDMAKMREEIKRLKQEQKRTNRQVNRIEKEL